MAVEYEQARRQAMAWVDAVNRRDLDAALAMFHEEMTHQGPFAVGYLGQDGARIDGRKAHGEFLRWVWAQQPHVHVFEEAFAGPDGFAFLTHFEHDGTRLVFVWQVGADGLVRDQRVYHAQPLAG